MRKGEKKEIERERHRERERQRETEREREREVNGTNWEIPTNWARIKG